MPYIRQEKRDMLDPFINGLTTLLNNSGEVNYTISRILYLLYNRDGYAGLNAVLGVLEAVKQEFYRRVVVPYEELKKEENGDVFQ